MRLVRLLMLFAVAAAALASSATAKEIRQVVVCGAGGCETLQGGDRAARLEALILGDDETSPPSASAFYTIKIVTTEGNSWTELYVPSAHKVRSMAPIGPQVWWPIPTAQEAVFQNAVRGVRPYPQSAFPGPTDRAIPVYPSSTGTAWLAIASGFALALCALGAVAAVIRHRRLRATVRPLAKDSLVP
jgi:hypothetical protein